jgi:DNA-binding transcriptional MerR regulator
VLEDPIIKKAYYSIGEVCEVTGLRPHVLRYWETQFQALHPTKNRAGNRVYRPEEVELILLVKRLLYEEKYTIEGADRRIREMRSAGALAGGRKDAVEPELLAALRADLLELRKILTPRSHTGRTGQPPGG